MTITNDDEWVYWDTPWSMGSAHSVSGDTEPESIVEQLHRVVEEVTGKPVERQARKIGFY